MKKIILSGLFVIIGGFLFAYLKYTEPIEPVKRPNSVPSDAVWHGAADGGNWIKCIPIKDSTNVFFCYVYSDYTGEILYKGLLKLNGKKTSINELNNQLGFYSGDYIYLKDGRIMKSLTSIDSITYEEMMNRDIKDYQK